MFLVILVPMNRQSNSASETKEEYELDRAGNGRLLPADIFPSKFGMAWDDRWPVS